MNTTAARLRRGAWTTAAVVFSVFCTALTASLAGTAGTPVWNVAIGCVLNLFAAGTLVYRHRAPWPVLACSVVGPLFFATDATAALIALFAVAAVERGARLVFASSVVYVACTVSLIYDTFRRRDYSALTIGTKIAEGGPIPEQNLALWIPFAAAAIMVGCVLAFAVLRRTTSDLAVAETKLDITARESADMREQMILTTERARIARDMHDTLAASLSRISLTAGGLQVNSSDGPERVANTASLIQKTAHDGLDELKRIIGVLRGTGDTLGVGGSQNLDGISDLVQSARSAGIHVTFFSDIMPGDVGQLCSHVAYRVVRESLTNAGRHAHGAPVAVSLSGNASAGLSVDVRNAVAPYAMVPDPSPTGGSGTGLTGLGELTRGVGGTFGAGRVGDQFAVSAWLPWYS